MNNKIKIIIALSLIILVWSLILFITRSREEEENDVPIGRNNEEVVEDNHGDEYPTEEDFLEVERIYQSLPRPLEKYIPEGASYVIEYQPEIQTFVVSFDAQNIEEFKETVKEAFGFFYQFNLDPCEEPLYHGIAWNLDDWSVIDFKDGDPIKEICQLN